MRHPSEYTTVPFGAMHVMEVDAGTVITDERSGETITVDDETAAVKGQVIFCTKKTFDALKRKSRSAFDTDDGQPTEAEEWRDLPYGSDMDGGEDEG